MKKLCILILAILLPITVLANENTLLKYLYMDDLRAWLGGGDSTYNWSNKINKDVFISKSIVPASIVFNDFNSNVFSASTKYGQKPQALDALIDNVQADSKGNPVVFFNVGWNGFFKATGFTVEEASQFKKGVRYNIVCLGFEYSNAILVSNNCSSLERYTINIAANEINNINYQNLRSTAGLNLDQVLLDYTEKSELHNFETQCSGVKYSKNCLDRASNIVQSSINAFNIDAKKWFQCYESQNKCDGIQNFEKKYNINFQDALERKSRQKTLEKDKKRKETVNKITNFLSGR